MPPPHNLRQDFVHKQMTRLLDHLRDIGDDWTETTEGAPVAPETVRRAREAISESLRSETLPAGDYYSRSPVVSLVQSAFDEQPEDVRDRARRDDGGPVLGIASSILARLFRGRHDFVDAPARADLGRRVRLVLISDWATGREDAEHVAARTWPFLYEPGVSAHLIHLGDTYYSGTQEEAQRNVRDLWPVAAGDAGTIGSWALNGNHDMYSGGYGLFEVTLGDERFARQRSDGRATSWFVLTTAGWNVVGLDTAWRHPEVDIRGDQLFIEGDLGHLHGSQVDALARCAADDRRLLVLSHHQLFSAYDEAHFTFGPDRAAATPLAEELADVLAAREIDAWFWGHEHDCLAYERGFGRVGAARAVGHGAVPTRVRRTPATPLGGGYPSYVVRPVTRDGDSDALRALAWEYRAERKDDDGRYLFKRGFAVLDIDGRELTVRYVDDEGTTWLTESI